VTTTIVHRLFEQALEREAAKPPAPPGAQRAVVHRLRDSRWLRLLRAA
jgi:hypothetical protein